MKPICLIAARGASKGVSRKNTKIIGGKPLIAHTIKASLESKIFSHVVVSTEDNEIAKIAERYGAEVPFLRPKKLATENASMDKVIDHAINKLLSLGYDFDVLVNRDCTAPFLRISDIKKGVSLFNKNKSDLVVAAYKTHLNPYFNMMEFDSKKFLKFSKKTKKRVANRQDAPTVYQLTGFWIINVPRFLKYKKIYMPRILPVEVPSETGLMIDTEFEFQIANCMFKKR
jgi:CMP-N-acetylneuraminic acid synthetase|tara:strand:- start:365 stop:1051 length:687 start_codon:yes stop_codon:yes gene_type:complete